MTCLTGGLTPCGAATGIPGRPATSSSPTCRARAALTKAFPGTPWSGARPTAAAQPGTARATTRPTRRPPAPLGSQAGSHRHPAQGDPEPTEAFDITAITSHPATAADTSRLGRISFASRFRARYGISLTCRIECVASAHVYALTDMLMRGPADPAALWRIPGRRCYSSLDEPDRPDLNGSSPGGGSLLGIMSYRPQRPPEYQLIQARSGSRSPYWSDRPPGQAGWYRGPPYSVIPLAAAV